MYSDPLLLGMLRAITPLDETAMAEARERQAQLTKPAGALGALEDASVVLCGIQGVCPPRALERPVVAVFAADHGVHARGVTPWPQEVTASMIENFRAGGAAVNVLARQVGAEVYVVDMGVAADVEPDEHVLDRKIREGYVGPRGRAGHVPRRGSRRGVPRRRRRPSAHRRRPRLPAHRRHGDRQHHRLRRAGGRVHRRRRGRGDRSRHRHRRPDPHAQDRDRVGRARAPAADRRPPRDPRDARWVRARRTRRVRAGRRRGPGAGRARRADRRRGRAGRAGDRAGRARATASRATAAPSPGTGSRSSTSACVRSWTSTCGSARAPGAALAFPLVEAAGAMLREMATFDSAGVARK